MPDRTVSVKTQHFSQSVTPVPDLPLSQPLLSQKSGDTPFTLHTLQIPAPSQRLRHLTDKPYLPALGGTTPTLTELSTLLTSLSAANLRPTIRIMIRPRGPPAQTTSKPPQDFLYTAAEISAMESSITSFISSGLLDPARGDGFVFGLLTDERGSLELDAEGNTLLVELARRAGFTCVLHRAVDEVFSSREDVEGVMEGVRRCGFEGMLTSGGRGRAVENLERLREAVEAGRREGVEVVVGGGVRRSNLGGLVEGLGAGDGLWFHSSCLGEDGSFDEEEAKGAGEELVRLGLEVTGLGRQ